MVSGKKGPWGISGWAHYTPELWRKYLVIYFYSRIMLQFCFGSGRLAAYHTHSQEILSPWLIPQVLALTS